MNIFRCLNLVLITGLLFSLPAHAQQWYQVELIVFEQLYPATDEQWPLMQPQNQVAVSPQTANQKIQPANHESLAGVAERIRNSANYRMLSYQSWQQSALGKNSSPLVAIEGERLRGHFQLYKSAYLHSELNLWLLENGASDMGLQGLQYPNLSESRRVRSKQLHYFDHPRFGAILELLPVDTPDAVLANMQGSESYSLPE